MVNGKSCSCSYNYLLLQVLHGMVGNQEFHEADQTLKPDLDFYEVF